MSTKVHLGSVSSGTMRTEDLIPAFASELKRLRGSLPRSLYDGIRHYDAGASCDAEQDRDELGSELVTELFDALDAFAPPYCYFGAHPGDGADYGFWVCEEFQERMREDGVLQVADTSEVPTGYSGSVLHVSDHGNATLYSAKRGNLTELWGIV